MAAAKIFLSSFIVAVSVDALPVSTNGSCGVPGLQFACAPGFCCSRWGFCGTSAVYCGAGCQADFGACNDVVVSSSASPPPSPSAPPASASEGDWDSFLTTFGKGAVTLGTASLHLPLCTGTVSGAVYSSAEEKARRLVIFQANLDAYDAFNSANPPPTFTLGVNQFVCILASGSAVASGPCPPPLHRFSDMTPAEFRTLVKENGGYRPLNHARTRALGAAPDPEEEARIIASLPTSVDWVAAGKVTPVKRQGDLCGSCWAFATVAAIEGAVAVATGTLTSMSEQHVVSCDTTNQACGWGNALDGLRFAAGSTSGGAGNGLCAEAAWPYTSGTTIQRGACNITCPRVPGSKVVGPTEIAANSVAALMAAIAVQPVVVSVTASSFVWKDYSAGVIDSPACYDYGNCNTDFFLCTADDVSDWSYVDHQVTAVGYGTDPVGGDYWLIKNSYGTSWGEGGYIKVSRSTTAPGIVSSGVCNVLYESYAVELAPQTTTGTASATRSLTPTLTSSRTNTATATTTTTGTTSATRSSTPTSTSTTSSSATKTATGLAILPYTTDGSCGAPTRQFVCRPGFCCSQWGFCGKTAIYCGAGCQSPYGKCESQLQSGNADASAGVAEVAPDNVGVAAAASSATDPINMSEVAGIAVALIAFAAIAVIVAVVVLRRRRAPKRTHARLQSPAPLSLAEDVEVSMPVS